VNEARPISVDAPPQPATRSNTLIYLLWIAGAVGTIATLLHGWLSPVGERDFAFFWVAGKLAVSGHAAQAYDLTSMRSAAAVYGASSVRASFPYPPHLLLIVAPLSLLPLTASFVVSQVLSTGAFYAAAKPLVPEGMQRWLAILTPAALVNFVFGQIGLLYGALWLWCFSGSAVAAALLTMKPHLGLAAVPEVVRKQLVIRTLAMVTALILTSIILFGFAPWQAFLKGASNRFAGIETGHFVNWYVQMMTPVLGYGVVGWLLFGAAGVALLIRRFNVFTAATTAFLISPYGFHYDTTVVCLGFGILLFERWRSLPAWQVFVCALAFLSPVLVRAGTWLIPPILLLGLYVQTEELKPRRSVGT
jgi:hypothetical protein